MTSEIHKNTTQAAAEKLAVVAAELEEAAATAPTPAQRLLLMRQWRKVQDAHDSLTRVESINTQSIPVQAPAAAPIKQEPAPEALVSQPQLTQAPQSVLLSRKVPRNVLVLGLVLPVWLLGCFVAANLDSSNAISPDVALLYYQLGIPVLVCSILAVIFGHQWRRQQVRLKTGASQQLAEDSAVNPLSDSALQVQVTTGMVLGYIGLGAAGLATLYIVLLVFSFARW